MSKKKKVGRPSRLSNQVIAQVELLAGFELTEAEIAQVIGVNMLTIRRWKTNEEYCIALKRGKAIVDAKVTKTLVKRALGYDYKEITRESTLVKVDANGKHHYQQLITKIVNKHSAPDVVAIIFWLKNRRRDLWREKEALINIEHADFYNKVIGKPKLETNRMEAYAD